MWWLRYHHCSYVPYPENRGVRMEKSEPHARVDMSMEDPSGVYSTVTRYGRHSSRIPLREDGRIRLRTEWNGNEV